LYSVLLEILFYVSI